MRRILVTGAGSWTGGRLIQRLESRPEVEVFAVDEVAPRLRFRAELHRMSLDQLPFADFLLDVKPETVVHLQTIDRSAELGSRRAQERTVVGAQALFGAIGRSTRTRHVVVKSDVAVYGAGPRNPSVFVENTEPQGRTGRYQRNLREMERFVERTGAEHDHVDYTILRFAPILGPTIRNPLSRYLQLPAVPTLLGFDPRLQCLFEEDAVRVLEHAIQHPCEGTFNVAATGQLYLSRILRLGLRLGQPLPRRGFEAALRGLGRLDLLIPDHVQGMLKHGLVADSTSMRERLGFAPLLNCRQAILAMYRRLPAGAIPTDAVRAP